MRLKENCNLSKASNEDCTTVLHGNLKKRTEDINIRAIAVPPRKW